jgi:hypothetical protein
MTLESVLLRILCCLKSSVLAGRYEEKEG